MRNKLYIIHQVTLGVIYIAMIVFFIFKCLETGRESIESSRRVSDSIAEVINHTIGEGTIDKESVTFQTFIRKFIGHYSYFVFFGFISTFFYLSFRKRCKAVILISISFTIAFLFAFISEFWLEGVTSGRGASINDVFIDFSGFCTSGLVIVLIYYIRYLKSPKIIENYTE